MLDPEKIDELARKLRELAKAERQSWRAGQAVADYRGARKGPRGGKRTTLEAKWAVQASYRDRLLRQSIDEAVAVLGIGSADLVSRGTPAELVGNMTRPWKGE